MRFTILDGCDGLLQQLPLMQMLRNELKLTPLIRPLEGPQIPFRIGCTVLSATACGEGAVATLMAKVTNSLQPKLLHNESNVCIAIDPKQNRYTLEVLTQ
jgi:hypothetical protein